MMRCALCAIASFLGLVLTLTAARPVWAQECCAIPSMEVASRETGPPASTYTTKWEMGISNAAYTNFDSKYVFEYPTEQGDDTCYDGLGGKGKYPPLNVVTGGDWPVDISNQWGPDYNGYGAWASYYQSVYGPGTSCGATNYQGLEISCADSWQKYAPNAAGTTSPNLLICWVVYGSETNYRREFSGQQVCAYEPSGTVNGSCPAPGP